MLGYEAQTRAVL